LVVMGKKGKEKKFGFIEGVLLLSKGRSMKERPQATVRVVEEEGVCCGDRRSRGCIDTNVLITSYVEDNTSQGKYLIFDFYSAVHVCSHM